MTVEPGEGCDNARLSGDFGASAKHVIARVTSKDDAKDLSTILAC